MKPKLQILLVLALFAPLALADGFVPRATPENATALDKYVATPDPAYEWKVVHEREMDGAKSFTIEMNSQNWRSADEVDRTLWQHHLVVVVPTEIRSSTGFLFIGGGGNDSEPPRVPGQIPLTMARTLGIVAAEIRQIPNQPLTFSDDGQPRKEDSAIAYTWDKFLRTGDDQWPMRLPMTKAVVRAMDTLEALVNGQLASSTKLERFIVAGGSKRGWTTWTTAAVDARVTACVPIVIDMLNIVPSFRHHWATYGFWAPAVDDYQEWKIFDRMETPEYAELMKIVEPYSYRDRLTMPKLLLNGSGDQFFLPDSAQFYIDDLQGPTWLRYVPNAGHGLENSDAVQTVVGFVAAQIAKSELPKVTWRYEDANTVSVSVAQAPKEVLLWQATNPETRDFRIDVFGPHWSSSPVEPQADGTYRASVEEPAAGWTAYFVELTYDTPNETYTKVTTPVRVTPDKTPFTYTPIESDIPGYLGSGKKAE